MWRTPLGERTLSGPEGDLFRELVGYVYDQLDVIYSAAGEPYPLGVGIFDRLEPAQQLALLSEVTEALLDFDVTPPALSAVLEATVAALFCELRFRIEDEFETGGEFWRTLLRSVFVDLEKSGNYLPLPTSNNLLDWESLINSAADRVLWDRDWAMEAIFVDRCPDRTDTLKCKMGIADDYFTSIAPDPTPQELSQIRERLNKLTGTNHPLIGHLKHL